MLSRLSVPGALPADGIQDQTLRPVNRRSTITTSAIDQQNVNQSAGHVHSETKKPQNQQEQRLSSTAWVILLPPSRRQGSFVQVECHDIRGYCRRTRRGEVVTVTGIAGRPASTHAAEIIAATPATESDSRFSRMGFTPAKNLSKYSSS